MKLRLLLFSVLLVLSSCATRQIEKSESDKIAIDMTSFNTRLSGYLFRKEMKGDLSGLTVEKYLQMVKTQSAPSEVEYAEFVVKKQPEIMVAAIKDDFAVCVRLVNKNFGICDKASTNFVDKNLDSAELNKDLAEITKAIVR